MEKITLKNLATKKIKTTNMKDSIIEYKDQKIEKSNYQIVLTNQKNFRYLDNMKTNHLIQN